MHNDSGICDNDSSPKSDGELSDNNMVFVYTQNQNGRPMVSASDAKTESRTPTPQRRHTDTPHGRTDFQNTPTVRRKAPLTPASQRRQAQQAAHQQQQFTHDIGNLKISDAPSWIAAQRRDTIECTNDSCVEDNDVSGSRIAHTPSCPYHVCRDCNGIVPHLQQQPQYRDTCQGHAHAQYDRLPQQSHDQDCPVEQLTANRLMIHSDVTYSDDDECSTEDDFGYMSMEKFNIYKDTVLRHHRDAMQCSDHEITTKIYFL